MLEVRSLSKKYHQKFVIKDFSYQFKNGLYLFVGTNGSGKSTTLKMMANLITSSNKNGYIKCEKCCYLCEKTELSNGKVYPFLSKIAKLNSYKLDIKKMMEKWNIPNKKMSSLSKGNKQKCAILMILFASVEVYLFDEPTDALDQQSINLFIEAVKELMIKNKTIIITTHEREYYKNLEYQEIIF